MFFRFSAVLIACALVIAGFVTIASSGQVARPGTEHPGELTAGRMWIENRGIDEAIPVVLQEPIALAQPAPVQARVVQQPWEYRTVVVGADQEMAEVLTRAGADGWEAVSVLAPTTRGTPVLLKRPR